MNFNILLCRQHSFGLCYLQAVGNSRYLQNGAVATVACSQLPITFICQMAVNLRGPETWSKQGFVSHCGQLVMTDRGDGFSECHGEPLCVLKKLINGGGSMAGIALGQLPKSGCNA